MLHDLQTLESFERDMEAMEKIKAQHAPQYKSEEEQKFMTRKINPLVKEYALLMHQLAPKICEKCETPLRVPELCWREEQNIANFLCYKCIGSLEKEGAMLEHDGVGRWMLKQKK